MSYQNVDQSATTLGGALSDLEREAERVAAKWGITRIEQVAGPAFAERWFRQSAVWLETLAGSDDAASVTRCQAMQRAWSALDRHLDEMGASPAMANAWHVTLPSTGEVVAIVRSHDDRRTYAVSHRGSVFSLDEIAALLDRLPAQLAEIKTLVPGSEIVPLEAATLPQDKQKPVGRTYPTGRGRNVSQKRARASDAAQAPLAPFDPDNGGDELPF